MKVIHIPYHYYPEAVAGTEIYVELLSANLTALGIESVVAPPAGEGKVSYHAGIKVRSFAFDQSYANLRDFYGPGDPIAAQAFSKILEEERPDLVHLHSMSYAVSSRLCSEITKRGLPYIYTYHTPTASCLNGTLMKWDRVVCDGRMIAGDCAACRLHHLGMPKTLATIIGNIPEPVAGIFEKADLRGGAWTALRMRPLARAKHEAFREVVSGAAAVVAVSEWVKNVLLINGVPAEKIFLSRQGIDVAGLSAPAKQESDGKINIIFLGRVSPEKGIDILIDSFKKVRGDKMRLNIYAVTPNEAAHALRNQLLRSAASDSRIRFHEAAPHASLGRLFQDASLLAVPSIWLESGPLVALEALAAGVPVIGSRIGGITETVRDGVDGILVPPGSVTAWSEALQKISDDSSLLDRLRRGVRPPKTAVAVAAEMAGLYRTVLSTQGKRL